MLEQAQIVLKGLAKPNPGSRMIRSGSIPAAAQTIIRFARNAETFRRSRYCGSFCMSPGSPSICIRQTGNPLAAAACRAPSRRSERTSLIKPAPSRADCHHQWRRSIDRNNDIKLTIDELNNRRNAFEALPAQSLHAHRAELTRPQHRLTLPPPEPLPAHDARPLPGEQTGHRPRKNPGLR